MDRIFCVFQAAVLSVSMLLLVLFLLPDPF